MEEKLYDTWILNEVELNICVRILGYSQWYHVEIQDNGEPLESRMLKGFMSLYEKGLVYFDGNHFLPSKRMEKLIGPLGAPDKMITEDSCEKTHVYFQKEGENLLEIEELSAEKGSFRLIFIPEKEIEEFLDLQDRIRTVREDKDDID